MDHPFYKSVWFYLALLLLLALGYTWYVGHALKSQLIEYQTEARDSIKYWKDKQGITHAEKGVVQMPAEVFNSSTDSDVVVVRKRFKAADLVVYSKATISSHDTIQVPVHDTIIITNGDTQHHELFEYQNKYLSVNGDIVKSDSHKDLTFGYDYEISLSNTVGWKRDKWYKKKELKVDFAVDDPNAHIVGMNTIMIAQPAKKIYETRAFSAVVGAVLGILISKR